MRFVQAKDKHDKLGKYLKNRGGLFKQNTNTLSKNQDLFEKNTKISFKPRANIESRKKTENVSKGDTIQKLGKRLKQRK